MKESYYVSQEFAPLVSQYYGPRVAQAININITCLI